MRMSRRTVLASSLAAAGLTSAGPLIASGAPPVHGGSHGRPRIKLGVSTYSYWHFKGPKVTVDTVIEKASQLGIEGVDILHRQMDIPEKEPLTAQHRTYLAHLKKKAFQNGIDLIALSIHQDFVDPDPAFRRQQVEHTLKCIEIAYALGIPCIRLNSGRWNTITDFTELMKAKGIEPVLPGHTEEDGFRWCQECIEQCLPKAAECGVMLALENHWGLTRTPEGLLRLLKDIPSPWLGALMDTGN